MRSIWKGSLAFGLVNVPIKVYSATEDHDIRFHQVHAKDGGRIRYQRVCEVCGEKVEYGDIGKAFEADDGRTIMLTDEDFEQLPANNSHEIEVSAFVPSEQIDPVLYDRSYYLEPASKSTKAYVLLQKTLQQTDRVAIVHFALRQKTRLAALRVHDDVLLVQTLLWPDEVRAANFKSLDDPVEIKPAELKMAAALVESFADDFRPEDYTDEYRVEMQQMIEAKLEGGEAFPAQEAPQQDEDAEVVDLLAALKRSVERGRGSSSTARSAAGGSSGSSDASDSDAQEADDGAATGTADAAPRSRSRTTGTTRSSRSTASGSGEDGDSGGSSRKRSTGTTKARSASTSSSKAGSASKADAGDETAAPRRRRTAS